MKLTEILLNELCTSWLQSDGEDYYNIIHAPTWSKGMCYEISHSLADFLNNNGFPQAKTVDVKHIVYKLPHTVVQVGNFIIDFTYRQFEDDGSVPYITSVLEYKKEFDFK